MRHPSFPRIEIIDHQCNDQKKQAKELPRLFDPGFFRLHRSGNVFGIMFGHPIKNAVFPKEQTNCVNDINDDADQICPGIKFVSESKPAKHGTIHIDRYPDIRIRIVVLKSC